MMVSDEGRTQRIPICGENFRDTSLLYYNTRFLDCCKFVMECCTDYIDFCIMVG